MFYEKTLYFKATLQFNTLLFMERCEGHKSLFFDLLLYKSDNVIQRKFFFNEKQKQKLIGKTSFTRKLKHLLHISALILYSYLKQLQNFLNEK